MAYGSALSEQLMTVFLLVTYMSEQDKKLVKAKREWAHFLLLKHDKEFFKKEVGCDCPLSGSQNFMVIRFWNQWLPNTSCLLALAST